MRIKAEIASKVLERIQKNCGTCVTKECAGCKWSGKIKGNTKWNNAEWDAEDGWRKADEEEPESSGTYLVLWTPGAVTFYGFCDYYEIDGWDLESMDAFRYYREYKDARVTHWMQLPEKPAEREERKC